MADDPLSVRPGKHSVLVDYEGVCALEGRLAATEARVKELEQRKDFYCEKARNAEAELKAAREVVEAARHWADWTPVRSPEIDEALAAYDALKGEDEDADKS